MLDCVGLCWVELHWTAAGAVFCWDALDCGVLGSFLALLERTKLSRPNSGRVTSCADLPYLKSIFWGGEEGASVRDRKKLTQDKSIQRVCCIKPRLQY